MQCSFHLGKDGDSKAIYSDQSIDAKSKEPLAEILRTEDVLGVRG